MYTFDDKPTGLPDPRYTPPEDFLGTVKDAMKVGKLEPNPTLLAKIEHEVAQYHNRMDIGTPERAHLAWSTYASGLPLGESVSLRPEATASVVRAYIEHGMQVLPGNAK